jgi:hypothetical protein
VAGQINRHAVGLLVVQCRENSFTWCHNIAVWCLVDQPTAVACPRARPRSKAKRACKDRVRADSRKRAGIAEGSLVAGNRAHRALELGSGDRGPLKNPRQAERASVGLEGRKKLSATVRSVSTVQRFPWPAGCAKGQVGAWVTW